MAARMKKWFGKEVADKVTKNVAAAMGEFALRAEGHSKRELQKGHGVITGTLRRSIHVAQPGYNWGGDDQTASAASPERGGQSFTALVNGKRITIQLGSGLNYALAVHQGHQGFSGYHYLTNGLEKARPELPGILRSYAN